MRRAVAAAVVALSAGCASFSGSFCDYGFCGAADPGADAGDAGLPVPPGCDTPTEPLQNPQRCLVDSFGAYVSPTGDDEAQGSRARPFRTITRALASPAGRIVACAGTYAETVDIRHRVELYGGVSCTFDGPGGKTLIEGQRPGFALRIEKVPARVADVEIVAAPGSAAAPTSVAVWIVESPDARLTRVRATAGAGFAGPAGEAGQPGAYLAGDGVGHPATAGAEGAARSCACTPGTTEGGKGGGETAAGRGADVIPALPADRTGAPGAEGGTCTIGAGVGGANRVDSDDAPRGTAMGRLDATGAWAPAAGPDGQAGLPGQGGGGGAAAGGRGGGGGCGGCGGTPGKGGGGGGGSIALVSSSSTVRLEGGAFTAGQGGVGGAGGTGSAGALGAAGGSGFGSGCAGGPGGAGGRSGAGGGGPGGVSFALVYRGARPARVDAQAQGGKGGAGGASGAGVPLHGPAGSEGVELPLE